MKKGLLCLFTAFLILLAAACNPGTEEETVSDSSVGSSLSSQKPVLEERETSAPPESETGGYSYDDFPDTIKNAAPFGNTRMERNRLWQEDLAYVREELPKVHENLFKKISEADFYARLDDLSANVGQFSDEEIEVELLRILAAVEDASTYFYMQIESVFPLEFRFFDGDVYIIAASRVYQGMRYTRVTEIDGVDIQTVCEKIETLFSEDFNAKNAYFRELLRSPSLLYALGILHSKEEAVFTVEKDGGSEAFSVRSASWMTTAIEPSGEQVERILGRYYTKSQDYTYLPDESLLFFAYNVGIELENESFTRLNEEMFTVIEQENPGKIVVDLRSNMGGDLGLWNPFLERLAQYMDNYPNTKVYVLTGRYIMPFAAVAVSQVRQAAPNAVNVGEREHHIFSGNWKSGILPLNYRNGGVIYSAKPDEINQGFSDELEIVESFQPDILLELSVENIKNGEDVLLQYVVEDS